MHIIKKCTVFQQITTDFELPYLVIFFIQFQLYIRTLEKLSCKILQLYQQNTPVTLIIE